MMTRSLAIFILLISTSATVCAQLTLKGGLMQHSMSTIELNIYQPTGDISLYPNTPASGSSFLVPIQFGGSFGERTYDVGVGLRFGGMKIEFDGLETKSSLLSPLFYVDYYVWEPAEFLQLGFGAVVSYSKVSFDRVYRDVPVEESTEDFDVKSKWAGLGYSVGGRVRYWLDEDWTSGIELGIGYNSDWRKVKSLQIDNEEVAFDAMSSMYTMNTDGYYVRLSYVKVLGE